jgi:CHAT domain-containing protein
MWRWIAGCLGIVLVCAIALRWSNRPSPEEAYARALSSLRDGDFEKSLAELRRVARPARGARENDAEWRSRLRLLEADVLIEQNRHAEAAALLDAEADDSQRPPEVRIVRRALNAKWALRRSQFQKAAELLNEAGQLAAANSRRDLSAEVNILRGELLGRQRRFAQAEAAYQEARRFAADLGDGHRQARALKDLGLVRMLQARSEEAIPLLLQALAISERLGADYTTAGAANNLGMCYAQLGDYDKALFYREQALRLARPSARLAEVLGETGTLHLDQGEPRQAAEFYRRALSAAEQFGVLPEAARWAGNLTLALIATADWDGAESALQKALSLKPEPRSRAFLEVNAAAIAFGRGRFDEARAIYEKALASAPDNALVKWDAHAGLADVWMALGNTARANQNFEAAIRVVEENRSGLNRPENRITFLSRLIRFYQQYVAALMAQDRPVAALEVADSSRARILTERLSRQVNPRPLQGNKAFQQIARDSESVWLSYWIAPRASFLWLVTPSEVRAFRLPPAADLARLVAEYRGFIERSLRDPLQTKSEAGRRLYEALIAPAAPYIAKGSYVIVTPDGPLHQLNLEALPVYGENPHYWIDDVTVAIAPSFGVFEQAKRRFSGVKKALVIGDPVSPAPEYPALPHAGAEIESVAKRLSPAHVEAVTRSSAIPASYAAAHPAAYDMIHIAAHAEANAKSPLDSAVILSPGLNGFKLYARDVVEVPLHAELVTLSACRSSGARAYGGEGLVGFAWAFLQAGSRAVIAGLWDVGDQSTALLMDRLYAEIAAGRPSAAALRRAKLALRETSFAKPYYWGPFQCYIR